MKETNPAYFGVVQARPKLSEAYQRAELEKAGCAPHKIVDVKDFDLLLSAVSPERKSVILVYRVDVLAGKRTKGGPLPRVDLRRRVKLLRKTGCPVIEDSTGRHCGEGDNMLDMVLDAYDRLAGNKAATENVGRPEKEMTPEQVEHARLVWTSTQYATNAEAMAALQKMGWTRWLMQKYKLGKSGRAPGKPKQK